MDEDRKQTEPEATDPAAPQDSAAPDRASATRRKLLKAGAAGVPLMITVGSSKAFAGDTPGIFASVGCYNSLSPGKQNKVEQILADHDPDDLTQLTTDQSLQLSTTCANSILGA